MAGFWIRIVLSMLAIAGMGWLFAAIGEARSGWVAVVLLLGGWVVYHLFYLQKAMAWLKTFNWIGCPMDRAPGSRFTQKSIGWRNPANGNGSSSRRH